MSWQSTHLERTNRSAEFESVQYNAGEDSWTQAYDYYLQIQA